MANPTKKELVDELLRRARLLIRPRSRDREVTVIDVVNISVYVNGRIRIAANLEADDQPIMIFLDGVPIYFSRGLDSNEPGRIVESYNLVRECVDELRRIMVLDTLADL